MKPILSAERYAIERAICDKAEAYRKRVAVQANGKPRNWLSADEARHPDYAACDNAMRGRVEQYELLTDPPARFAAYIGKPLQEAKPETHNKYISDNANRRWRITTWTGDVVGLAECVSTWRTPHSFVSSTMSAYRVTMAGKVYHGRGACEGMAINLRRAKG